MRFLLHSFLLIGLATCSPAVADSSSANLAAYYDRQMAIVDGRAYAWGNNEKPVQLRSDAAQVGVGRDWYYILTTARQLLGYRTLSSRHDVLADNIVNFSAGATGVFAIGTDGVLWWLSSTGDGKQRVAEGVARSAIGDGANYYITTSGDLFVRGAAHRGQYGDGKLQATDRFVKTASDAKQIAAHTGHAILLHHNGDVLGTGGNIYGPVGRHGLGDKAVRWSHIMSGARAIATGASHSLAIRSDYTLMAWGSGYGPEPIAIMRGVAAVAAGSRTTIALKMDGTLWQWDMKDKPRQILWGK